VLRSQGLLWFPTRLRYLARMNHDDPERAPATSGPPGRQSVRMLREVGSAQHKRTPCDNCCGSPAQLWRIVLTAASFEPLRREGLLPYRLGG
jgi:hypothetical protein